jgi:hypothetical protein
MPDTPLLCHLPIAFVLSSWYVSYVPALCVGGGLAVCLFSAGYMYQAHRATTSRGERVSALSVISLVSAACSSAIICATCSLTSFSISGAFLGSETGSSPRNHKLTVHTFTSAASAIRDIAPHRLLMTFLCWSRVTRVTSFYELKFF